ncbi:hypothetical protein ACFL96_05055 [Thermoproteota archaeon]
MTLESIFGPLAETYKKVDPSTISSSAEIMKERQNDKELRREWFWTRESAMYTVEDGEVMLRLTDKVEDNLIFQDIEEATRQLIRNNNYVPSDKESIERIVGSVEGVKLSDLDLKKGDDEYSYFEIDTSGYDSLNGSQRLLAEKAYGVGDDFKASMKMLNDAGIKETRFYVTNPEYVEKHVEGDGVLVRACRLYCCNGDSSFLAFGRDVDDNLVGLRGVLINPPEADARNLEAEEDKYLTAYETLVGSPERITPDIAAGLSGLLTTYLNTQKE